MSIVLRDKDKEEFEKLKKLFPKYYNTDIVRKLINYYKATSPNYKILIRNKKLKEEEKLSKLLASFT